MGIGNIADFFLFCEISIFNTRWQYIVAIMILHVAVGEAQVLA